jgi:hypothetical protein
MPGLVGCDLLRTGGIDVGALVRPLVLCRRAGCKSRKRGGNQNGSDHLIPPSGLLVQGIIQATALRAERGIPSRVAWLRNAASL